MIFVLKTIVQSRVKLFRIVFKVFKKAFLFQNSVEQQIIIPEYQKTCQKAFHLLKDKQSHSLAIVSYFVRNFFG